MMESPTKYRIALRRLDMPLTHSVAGAPSIASRHVVTPNSKWRALLPGGAFSKKWKRLGKVVGASDWPASSIPGYTPPPSRTVGATAEYLAQRFPALVKGHGSAWSRREIETVLAGLIQHVLGIASFGWDDRFVEDLRLD